MSSEKNLVKKRYGIKTTDKETVAGTTSYI